MSKELESKLLKAKIELMTRSVFISTISLSVRQIISDHIPTAATQGTKIWYNPDFLGKLTVQETAGLMAHECWHIAFQHISRLMGRDPIVWNYAGDYVINNMLAKEGFILPGGGLLDPKYDGMSTEEVYDFLMNNEPPKSNPNNIILDIQGGNNPSGDAENGQQAGGQAAQDVEEQQAITDMLVRAHTQAKISGAKAVGQIPGEILRIIHDLSNPKLPWGQLLNRFLDQQTRDEYSWARRNRRHQTYMPSLHSYGLGHLFFAVDTSGSETDEDLVKLLSEMQGIRDTFRPQKMTIIDCDRRINNVWEIDDSINIMSLKFSGGGGTDLQPPLDYAKEHKAHAIIYFTDLYAAIPDDPDIPVMWICNSDHTEMPFGETIYVD